MIGAGGVRPAPPGYIEAVAAICKRHGVLLVIDSVICAFGRVGTWLGYERWDIEPDMVVLAKGITSGYLPLGGVIDQRTPSPSRSGRSPGGPMFRHGATYAGHPTCCAAALANLDILERENLIPRGRELEGELMDVLAPLAEHPRLRRDPRRPRPGRRRRPLARGARRCPGAMVRYSSADPRGRRAAARRRPPASRSARR